MEISVQLIDRLKKAIGDDKVVTNGERLEVLSRTCIPYREIPSVVVYPVTAQDVQSVVLLANEFNVPVWPVSTGKNWGYGEQTACYPGGITMILNRMNKIWHVDEKLGYAVIEPGVTYQQLNDFLKANRSSLWADVTGSTQSGSVIGNALDKGRGLTPYADHFGHLCGMDVVLPDGKILETGGGQPGNNHAKYVYKWGIGPYLEGIFAQSNYGIVVKAGIWLMPAPQCFDWVVFEYTAAEKEFGAFMEDFRGLAFRGALRGRPHLANDFAMLCIVAQYPHELLKGANHLSAEAIMQWRKSNGIALWSFASGLYGSPEEIKFQKREFKHVLGRYGRVQFLGRIIKNDLPAKILYEGFKLANKFLGKSPAFIESLLPAINLSRGIPTDHFAKQVYCKSSTGKPTADIIDPAKDQCGVLWLGPLVPFTSEHILKVIEFSRSISDKHGFDYFLEIIVESPRTVIFLLGVLYDRQDEKETNRARAWYEETQRALLQNGYPSYRTTTMSMPHSLDNDQVSKDFFNTIKKAIDPRNIIAPGRYGIMAEKNKP